MRNNRKIPKTIRVKRKKFITDYINNKTVMHIGCTGGLLGPDNEKIHIENYNKLEDTHYIFSKFSKELSGLDISKSKIEFLKSQGFNNLYTHDICDLNFHLDKKYDVVLFPNIIEHLSNVGNALQNIKKLMRKDSKLIITTNNAFDILVIFKLFFNYESVHDEHTSYYSYSTMKRILKMNELNIENFYFASNEKKWSFKNNKLQLFLKILQNTFGTIFKQFSEDLVFVVTKV